ncbi:MAG: hypothetical protein U0984_03935 [Prosthecobacter sp.]|nr:hypothetical protein [Prosthecobacter sp.]
MRTTICIFLFAAATGALRGGDRETGDYNFDGHNDYRVYRESNGKQHFYDHYLFDPRTKKFIRSALLSELINPQFIAATKEIHCIWPGGHSGKIFYREDYQWQGKRLAFLRVIRQDSVNYGDGSVRYVRVTTTLENGKPSIQSIEPIP